LQKFHRISQCDLHWFDEKPLSSSVGKDAQIQKDTADEVHYTQLTLCNTVYGFKVLKVIKHEKRKFVFSSSNLLLSIVEQY